MLKVKYYITTFLLAIAFTVNAQVPTGPEIACQRCYGTSGGDNFFDAIITSDNSIIASIYYGGYDGDATDLFTLSHPAGLIKFDSGFNMLWQNYFGGSDNISYFKKIIEDSNTDIIGAGNTSSFDIDFSDNHGNLDFMMVKTDHLGNKLWSKCYGSPGTNETEGFIKTLDGGYLLTGYSNGSGGDIPFHYGSGFTNDAIIIKTDSAGELLWLKVLGGSGDDLPLGDIVEIERGYYIINIGTYSNDQDLVGSGIDGLKRWIVKLDSLGNIVDENFIQGNLDLYTYTNDMVIPYNNGIMVVGNGNANSLLYPTTPEHALEEGAVAVFDENLELTLFKQWGGSHIDGFKRVVQDENGNFIFLGYSESSDFDLPGNFNNGETVDYWLFSTDSNFNPLWSKNFGGSDPCGDLGCGNFSGTLILKDNMLYAFIKNVVPETLPDFDIACGELGVGNTDAWLVAFDLTTVNTEEPENSITIKIYPNPTDNELFIDLTAITETQIPVRIVIYNLIGNKILEQELVAGEIQKIALNNFSAGIYLLQCYQENLLLHTEKVMVE